MSVNSDSWWTSTNYWFGIRSQNDGHCWQPGRLRFTFSAYDVAGSRPTTLSRATYYQFQDEDKRRCLAWCSCYTSTPEGPARTCYTTIVATRRRCRYYHQSQHRFVTDTSSDSGTCSYSDTFRVVEEDKSCIKNR